MDKSRVRHSVLQQVGEYFKKLVSFELTSLPAAAKFKVAAHCVGTDRKRTLRIGTESNVTFDLHKRKSAHRFGTARIGRETNPIQNVCAPGADPGIF